MIGKVPTFAEFVGEAKQIGALYHYTTIFRLDAILKENSLRPMSYSAAPSKMIFGSTQPEVFTVSTTRDRNFHRSKGREYSGVGGVECRLELDGAMISQKYKIVPFNYFNRFGNSPVARPATPQLSEFTESEEAILTTEKGLTDLSKYLRKVTIFTNDKIHSNPSSGKLQSVRWSLEKLRVPLEIDDPDRSNSAWKKS